MSDDRTVEELLAAVDVNAPKPPPVLRGIPTVQAWVGQHEVAPGSNPAADATTLYRHYRIWCDEQNYTRTSYTWFFNYLRKQVGLGRKMRKMEHGREQRIYLMHTDAARYFRDWKKLHPTPEDEFLPSHQPKSRIKRFLESK